MYGYDPYVSVDAAWNLSRDVKHVLNVEDIYSNCDIITIHVPLMDSTKGMIDKDAISKMKDGVILLNFARDLLYEKRMFWMESGKEKSESMFLIFQIQQLQDRRDVLSFLIWEHLPKNRKITVQRWQ